MQTATFAFTTSPASVARAVAGAIEDVGVDPLGRPLDDPAAIRSGIPSWHPRNDGDDNDDDDDDDGGDDDDDEDDDHDDDKRKKDPKAKDKPKPKSGGKASDDDDDSDDDDHDDDDPAKAAIARAKAAEARAKKAEAEARKLRRAEDKRKRAQQQDDGEFKELYEAEKTRADGLERKLREGALERTVTQLATESGARKPSRILKLLDLALDDVVDEDGEVDDDVVKRAIRDLKKSDRYLFKGEDAQTTDLSGDRKNGRRRPSTDEDVRGSARIRRAYETSSSR